LDDLGGEFVHHDEVVVFVEDSVADIGHCYVFKCRD
jgi:hypothetical protein